MKSFKSMNSASVLAVAIACAVSGTARAEDVKNDEIIVTASPLGRSVDETIFGASVLSEEDLARRLENSIGETLRREPGVSSTFFGPGASRPVIRGLGGDRIRVLDAGIGSIDASASSPDHAVAVEPATAQRIEIVRGTSMLRYGSSATGGVVNVFSGRIPTERPEGGVDGGLRIGGSTVDGGVEAAGGFDVELGQLGDGVLVFHGDGFYREADDYSIPGFAESERFRAFEEAEEEEHDDDDDDDHDEDEHEEEEETFGTAENSFYETKGGSAGFSWIFDNGFFGVSGTAIDSTYGLPGGHEHGHEHGEDEHDDDHDDDDHDDDHHDDDEHEGEENGEEEGGVITTLRQRRLDVHGGVEADLGLFNKAELRLGYANYEHMETEPSGEPGTVFANEGWEGRLELINKPTQALGGELNGALGFQFRKRDFSAIGAEAFVPPTDTTQFGVFAVEELTAGPFRIEVGGRFENTRHEVQATGFAREFNGFSASGGIGYRPTSEVFFGVSAFRTERAPSTEELFANGPHLAIGAFEIGNPTFNEEIGRGVEATARYSTDRFSASINGYYTSYNDFIFERETDEEEDELPVFQFVAEDVNFRGFEAQMEAELFQLSGFDIHGNASVDYVRATSDVVGNQNLPRIPPLSGLIGLEAKSEFIDVRAEFEFAADQDDVSDFELPTDGYQVVNAFVTLRPFTNARNLSLRVSGNNLTDEEVRLHTSFIKDLVPLPGRNIKFSIEGSF